MNKEEAYMNGLRTCQTIEIMDVACEQFGVYEVNMFLFECLEDGKSMDYVRAELLSWIEDSVHEIVGKAC